MTPIQKKGAANSARRFLSSRGTGLLSVLFLVAGCSPTAGPVGHPPPGGEISAAYRAMEKRKGNDLYPGKTWERLPVPDTPEVRALETYLFSGEKGNPGKSTDGVVVIRRGRIVYEKYSRGYHRDSPHLAWSVTKGLTNAMVGVAVRKKILSLDEPVSRFYSPLRDGEHAKITIRHLLQMSSGIHWNEGYESNPVRSDVLNMLYGRGAADMALYTARRPMAHPPGRIWLYSSGDTNILMAVLREKLQKDYDSFPWKEIFDPLGVVGATLEQDRAGTFVGSSYLYARAVDLARLGYLYLNDGVWRGKRILPEGWVRFSTTMARAYYSTPLRPDMIEDEPGAQFFLNIGDPSRDLPRPWPSAPPDTFATTGHWGQIIVVIPSQDMVLVRVADDRIDENPEDDFQKDRFFELALRAFGSPENQRKAP